MARRLLPARRSRRQKTSPVSWLVRKFSLSKWERFEDLATEEIAADAITADLRTSANSLSCWRCETSGDADVRCAALAVAAAGQKLDRVDVVVVEESALTLAGLDVRSTPGKTPVRDLRARHVDVVRLDHVRLGRVARIMRAGIDSQRFVRMTRDEVLALVVGAVQAQRIAMSDLSEDLRRAVAARVE